MATWYVERRDETESVLLWDIEKQKLIHVKKGMTFPVSVLISGVIKHAQNFHSFCDRYLFLDPNVVKITKQLLAQIYIRPDVDATLVETDLILSII